MKPVQKPVLRRYNGGKINLAVEATVSWLLPQCDLADACLIAAMNTVTLAQNCLWTLTQRLRKKDVERRVMTLVTQTAREAKPHLQRAVGACSDEEIEFVVSSWGRQ